MKTKELNTLVQPTSLTAHECEAKKAVLFEYVYPDEDGGTLDAMLDMVTGIITITDAQDAPLDIMDRSVRTRIWVSEDDGIPEEPGDGVDFEAILLNTEASEVWALRKRDLALVHTTFD